LVDIKAASIDVDRVRGRLEGGVFAGHVSLVASLEFGEDGRLVNLEVALLEFEPTPMGALFRGRGEEDLHLCVRKYDRLDVAPFHDNASPASHLLLERDETATDGGESGELRGELANLWGANVAGDIATVYEDLIAPIGPPTEIDLCVYHQLRYGVRIVPGKAALAGRPGEGAVHGARVDVGIAKALSDEAGDSTLARTHRTVYGDAGAAAAHAP
jgi:hypothetical protein